MTDSTVTRTSAGLQEHLFNQLDGLESGAVTPSHARAVASLAHQVLAVSRLEMEFTRFVSEHRADDCGDATRELTLGARRHVRCR